MSNDNYDAISGALIEQCPDAIVYADVAGVIRVWNRAAVRIFGFSQEQAIGKSLDIIIPESFREAHWRGFDRAISDRETKYVGRSLPTKALRADGTTIYVELGFSIVLGSDGEVLGALSSARDITVRHEKEREDRKRLRELEAAAK